MQHNLDDRDLSFKDFVIGIVLLVIPIAIVIYFST